jgi:hypothetical protein
MFARSTPFETATHAITDLQQRLELFMSSCQRCGRCFDPPTVLEQLKMTGYRLDDLQNEQWIFMSKASLAGGASADDMPIELD